jgi:lactate 2-monooxygenase
VELAFTDPVFQKHFKEKNWMNIEEDKSAGAAESTRTVFLSLCHGWGDIEFLKEHWDGPIVLKGIQTVEDALKRVEVGVQGFVISNHGGREADGGVSSLSRLQRIVDAVRDEIESFLDSGIRCGAGIAKALALGAKYCLIGRPYVYGLTLGGEDVSAMC